MLVAGRYVTKKKKKPTILFNTLKLTISVENTCTLISNHPQANYYNNKENSAIKPQHRNNQT